MSDDDYLWNPSASPDAEIERLEALLRPAAHVPVPLRARGAAWRIRGATVRRWQAIAAVLVLTAGALVVTRRSSPTPWAVDVTRGTPVIRSSSGTTTRGTLAGGGTVETDAQSSAVLTVGRIGRATIGPGSRLRLLGDDAARHLLALDRGTMHANIDAPPRYFLVQTPSVLAVDLGCVYTLTVDERGSGSITVDEGEVELVFADMPSSVPAGNSAALLDGRGPGLPFPTRASDSLRRAVAAYDADPASVAAVDQVLAASDARSTISLWHLLRRVPPEMRERVYLRLSAIAPAPASVTRERVLRAESGALQRWRTELEPGWINEPPLWKRVWARLR
jgi:hypothetical protein